MIHILAFNKARLGKRRFLIETGKHTLPEPAKMSHGCNCRQKTTCPLENNCLTPSIVYNAKVTTTEDPMGKNYIGLTEGPFKQRYTQHALSFRNRHYANRTKLSKFIWRLKDSNTAFEIKWSTDPNLRRRLQQ